MTQDDPTIDKPNLLELPPLELQATEPIGQIRHVLQHAGSVKVRKIELIQTSPRLTDDLYHLENGQRIIVTSRKRLSRPARVDGVIQIEENGTGKWLSHRLLDQLNKAIHDKGWEVFTKQIASGWQHQFTYDKEQRDPSGTILRPGLRPPQIGSLHAIGAHWSLHTEPATVVMPTGTGKTETMLATLVAHSPGTLLIVVPSKVLRNQTATKFLTLGLLRSLGNLEAESPNPVVGIITKRPRDETDLTIFQKCNVVITTMSALAEASTSHLIPKIAGRVGTLIVDEAHHIGAASWSTFREHFSERPVLQFTATPYRRDGKLVDGKVIYDYPLDAAQRDGYFKKISFQPIYEIDQSTADQAIAKAAVTKLQDDDAAGFSHVVMARCSDIDRAKAVIEIYKGIAPELNAVIVHSEAGDPTTALDQLRSGQSRVVVCVNMLGEGFDLPQLKIAAVHDTHKSLAVLLQFTGRFTRTAGITIGDATVIANIADQEVSSALERLYSEDANWNQLLSEFSSEASRSHTELVEFLNSSQRLDEPTENETVEISHHLLHPMLSTLTYEAGAFRPKEFFKGLPKTMHVHRVWLHEQSNTLYFVTRTEPTIKWTRSRELHDRQWDLFVLHYDSERGLLFLSSSDHDTDYDKMAKVVGATKIISGDVIFRTLGNINRLVFQNVGVKKHGRRNLRYALYTGADVAEALSISERAGSVKSNLSGSGWEDGEQVSIGCSYKGRVWAREPGTIPEFVNWCAKVGKKLQDQSIDTTQIIANVLIPEEVDVLPDKPPLSIEWPVEILHQSEERVILSSGNETLPISMFDMKIVRFDVANSQLTFVISTEPDEIWGELILTVGGADGFRVSRSSRTPVSITIGQLSMPIESYLSNYPPMVRFVDLSELDGNLLIRPQNTQEMIFPGERLEAWDWSGVDITKESIWKHGARRANSIQERTAQHFTDGGFEVVFDDDDAGEAADLICLKEEDEHIRLALIHCKFTQAATPGERVKDVVEVCSQAVRSAKWKGKFRDLSRHMIAREKRSANTGRSTRFFSGQVADLNKYLRISRFKPIKPEISIVQPGLSQSKITPDQTAVLASAYSYLKETIGADLDVVCSP